MIVDLFAARRPTAAKALEDCAYIDNRDHALGKHLGLHEVRKSLNPGRVQASQPELGLVLI
jgi:hypothetical protein